MIATTAADCAALYERIRDQIAALDDATREAVLPFYNAFKRYRAEDDAAARDAALEAYEAALAAMAGVEAKGEASTEKVLVAVAPKGPTVPYCGSAHWAAAAFPMLDDDAMFELIDDIAAHGLQHPIELLDGVIVDGRNRLHACELAGVEPRFVDAPDYARADVVAYVISKNLRRRHLDESQRAMVAAKLRDGWQRHCPNLDTPGTGVRAAAAALNVSPQSVATAAKVHREAAPELVAAVEAGKVAVSAAAELVALPAEEQREAAANPVVAKKKASEARARKRTPREVVPLPTAKAVEPTVEPGAADVVDEAPGGPLGWGNGLAPVGSVEHAKRWRLDMQAAVDQIAVHREGLAALQELGAKHDVWTKLASPTGAPFSTLAEFLAAPRPHGVGCSEVQITSASPLTSAEWAELDEQIAEVSDVLWKYAQNRAHWSRHCETAVCAGSGRKPSKAEVEALASKAMDDGIRDGHERFGKIVLALRRMRAATDVASTAEIDHASPSRDAFEARQILAIARDIGDALSGGVALKARRMAEVGEMAGDLVKRADRLADALGKVPS